MTVDYRDFELPVMRFINDFFFTLESVTFHHVRVAVSWLVRRRSVIFPKRRKVTLSSHSPIVEFVVVVVFYQCPSPC